MLEPPPHQGPFTGPLQIPKITNRKLEELFTNLQPLYLRGVELWRMARPASLRDVSYIWDPKLTERVSEERLTVLGHFRCLHTWAYYGFFKPSVAEVLSQVPETFLPEAQLFQIFGPETSDDLNKESQALNAGFHVSTVVLYKVA